MKILENTGFVFKGRIFNIFLNAVICDALARAFVKCIKTHNSYNCCERCVQIGEWHNKIVLPGLDCIDRTDESFIANHDPSCGHITFITIVVRYGFIFSFGLYAFNMLRSGL